MNPTLRKRIGDREKDIKDTELLIAAGKGAYEKVRRLLEENADVNFADTDGNTALHYAVESGCPEVVQLLLEKMGDLGIENNDHESAFGIAWKSLDANIIELLQKKNVDNTFKLLKEELDEHRKIDIRPVDVCQVLSREEREIQNAEDKIKYCLASLKKLNKTKSEAQELSYEQANILIFFVETFALEGSGREDIKLEMKNYFGPYFKDEDRLVIRDARILLLKKSNFKGTSSHSQEIKLARKLRVTDIKKFIRGDISSFFEKMEIYVKHVYEKKGCGGSETELCSFLNTLEREQRNLGEEISDVKSFLKEEFKKLIIAAYGQEPITPEELFNFTMNFCPIFNKETNRDFEDLINLRNKLIHQFHKYGCVQLGNEIYSLRSKLFKYYYAQEVLKILNLMEPNENSEIIRRKLESELEAFNEHFEDIYGTETVISEEEAKCCIGYEFSQSMFPERSDTDIKDLVSQYLNSMILFECEEKYEEDPSQDITDEYFLRFVKSNEYYRNDEQDNERHNLKRDHVLSDVDRREIFEKYDGLKRIKRYCSTEYEEEKQKMRDELVNKYGINGCSFDNVCKSYVDNNEEFLGKNKSSVEEITKIIRILKKIKDKHKLSNEYILSMYDKHLQKHKKFDSIEKKSSVGNSDQKIQKIIKNELPRAKSLDISVGCNAFRIRTDQAVNNMLKTFYNAYHKYRVKFNIDDIFNDEIFLHYLVKGMTEEIDISDLVDEYFNLVILTNGEDEKSKGNKSQQNRSSSFKKDVIEKFNHLRKCRNQLSDLDYENEKEKLCTEIVNKKSGISKHQFYKICHTCIENHAKLENEDLKKIKNVKSIISKLKSLNFSHKKTISLFECLIEGQGKINLQEYRHIPQNLDDASERNLEKLYSDFRLNEDEVSIGTETETFKLYTRDLVLNMLLAFKGKRQFKNTFFTYMVIKKLLNIEYCTPLIVKLITEVKSDIEKTDLVELMKILCLNGRLYADHLLSLLDIKSEKLNIYYEFVTIFLEQSINIESVHVVFKEPRHLKEILKSLCNKIGERDSEQNQKAEKMAKYILQFLNTSAHEIYRSEGYDIALKVLKEAQRLTENLFCERAIDNGDLHDLGIQYQIATLKTSQGFMERNEDVQMKLLNDGLESLSIIKENLLLKNGSSEIRNFEIKDAALYLLVLREIAVTKQKLNMHEEAYKQFEVLYHDIIKFVLDLPSNYSLRDDILKKDFYSDIAKSRRYEKLLSFSRESATYLDILNIKIVLPYFKYLMILDKFSELNCAEIRTQFAELPEIIDEFPIRCRRHFEKSSEEAPDCVFKLFSFARSYSEFKEQILKTYEEFLEIFKEVYDYKKKYKGNIRVTMRAASIIVSLCEYVNNRFPVKLDLLHYLQLLRISIPSELSEAFEHQYHCSVWLKPEDMSHFPRKVLLCQNFCLLHESRDYSTQREILWANNPTIVKARKSLMNSLNSIAHTYRYIGHNVPISERRERFEKALEIQVKLYGIGYYLEGERHSNTLRSMHQIGHIYGDLDRLPERKTKLEEHTIQK